MTRPVGRMYATALALVLFFLTWAVVAAQPWATAAGGTDPRLKALSQREARLRREAKLVERVVARRWAVYRRELAVRRARIAAVAKARAATPAPQASVRVVTLPPLTITRTS